MKITSIPSVIESTRQVETPVSRLYFSDQNLKLVQRAVKESVKQQTGFKIDNQNYIDLVVIMRGVYFGNYKDLYSKTPCVEVRKLNKIAIDKCVNQVADGLLGYMGYLNSVYAPMTPLSHSKYSSMKGETPLIQDLNM